MAQEMDGFPLGLVLWALRIVVKYGSTVRVVGSGLVLHYNSASCLDALGLASLTPALL